MSSEFGQSPTSGVRHDAPAPGSRRSEAWGSDLIAETLRDLDIRYVANVPGSTYAGLHDSIVNYLGNRAPQLILAIHEETAVAIAHGYAKASGRMMAAALHANIGLLRAPMAIYNAWCDRMPVLLLGASGPWDATRRNSFDWIHTSTDQGGLIRDFTKWDSQPGSPRAAVEALLRAAQIARTAPRGPVYVNLDIEVQRTRVGKTAPAAAIERYAPPPAVHASPELVAAAAKLLSAAERPVVLMGRCSHDLADWNARVALAERLDVPVLTHLHFAAAFPTDHRLHVAPPGLARLSPAMNALVGAADAILALDWPDLAETLDGAFGGSPIAARIVRVSLDAHSHRGGTGDHRGLPPADLYLMCDSDTAVAALLAATSPRSASSPHPAPPALPPPPSVLTLRGIADALVGATQGLDVTYTRLPFRWHGAYLHFRHPLDYIGFDGASGVGSGPGITVGAALALKGSGRVPIAILGDGDFLMGNTAIWTAARYGLPCLLIVCNNRSFFMDEEHQARMARDRDRETGNSWIGVRLEEPAIDIAAMARAQGAVGIGPIGDIPALGAAIAEGIAHVRAGAVAVIDVRIVRGREDTGAPPRPAAGARVRRTLARVVPRRVKRAIKPPRG